MPLANHITALRRLPEFKGVEYLADLLLKPGRSNKRRRLNDGQFLTTNQTNLKERDEEVGDGKEVNGRGRTIQQQSLPPNLSRPLPVGVIPAALPSRGEAEVDEIAAVAAVSLSFVQATLDMEDRATRHEAWIASLPTPTPAQPTAAEEERVAMIARRQDFMASLVENPLTEETLARARDAHIFIT